MNKIKKIFKIFLSFVMTFSFSSITFSASDIILPQEELAQESVLPVFDNPVSVKNRNVQTTGKIDVGFFGGLALTEPIANTTKLGLAINYHFNEYHAFGGLVVLNSTGLSKDAQGIKEDQGLDFGRAPQPNIAMLLDYNYKPYYGKMSFSKELVLNTIIYGSAAFGVVKYKLNSEEKQYPAFGLGLGEKFFFGQNLSLKTDFRLLIHQAPIPFKAGLLCDGSVTSCGSNGAAGDPIPTYGDFSERITYTTNLEVGLNYLF